jgi:hypothetical protein
VHTKEKPVRLEPARARRAHGAGEGVPRRAAAILSGAIALFASASVAIIALVTRDPAAGVSRAAPPPPVARELDAAPAAADAPRPIVPASTRRPAPVVAPPGADVPWEQVPALQRWPALTYRIAESEPRIRDCIAAGSGGAPGSSRPPGGSGPDAYGRGVLMLHLETLQDALRIVDAPVEKRGAASDVAIACTQDALRGLSIPLPGTAPGSRMRVRYAVK